MFKKILICFIALTIANCSDAKFIKHGSNNSTLNTIQTLKVGAGGQITNVDIQCDQGVGSCNNSGTSTKVIRTDTYGAYEWCNNQWVQLVTTTSLPAADPNNVIGACIIGEICGVYEIQIAPSNTNIAYMYFNGYVYKTTNLRSCGNVAWTATGFANAPSNPNDNTKFEGPYLAIDPSNPNTVMVGTPGGSAFYSTNGGTSFTAVTGICSAPTTGAGSSQGGGYVFAFDRSTSSGGTTPGIYLGCYGTGIYHSTTGVTGTFTLTTGTPTTFNRMLCDSAGTLYLALGTDNLIRWYNGTWNNNSVGVGQNVEAIAIDPATNLNILVIDPAGNTSYTTSGPSGTWSTWSTSATISASSDIPWFVNSGDFYFSSANITYDPALSNVVYYAAGIGVWTFPASGVTTSQTYTGKSIGIEQLVATWVVSPPGGKPILTAWDRPVWTVTNPDVVMSNYGINHAVEVTEGYNADWCSQNPSTVVALINGGNSSTGSAGISTDGGGTGTPSDWSVFGTQALGSIPPDFGFGGHIACLDSTHALWAAGFNHDLYTTADGGATWGKVVSCSGVPTGSTFSAQSQTVPVSTGGTITFTNIGAGLTYPTSNSISVFSGANSNNQFSGTIASYNSVSGQLVINVTAFSGSGVHTDWYINQPLTGWGAQSFLLRHIAAADRVANTYYAYNYSANAAIDGVYTITANGATCTRVKTAQFDTSNQSGFNASLRTVPGNSGHVFFTSGSQTPITAGLPLYWNTTGGSGTWNTIANVVDVVAFGFGKTKPGFDGYPTLYCYCSVDTGSGHNAASYGLWQAVNVDTTPIWRQLSGFAIGGSLDGIAAIEGDADTYGIVYGAKRGSGFFYGRYN